jgi:hypothetical protein
LLISFNLSGPLLRGANWSLDFDHLDRLKRVSSGDAVETAYIYDAAGNRLTYSGIATNGGDTVSPGISILSPTNGATYSTANSSVTLSGLASDNVGVSKVTWENDNAQFGLALGTTNWTIPNLPLHPGSNYFAITAHDEANNLKEASLTVIYAPPAKPNIEFNISSSSLNLSWPASAADFVLQYAESLSPPILWSNAAVTFTTNSATISVKLPATNTQQFFRLQQQ